MAAKKDDLRVVWLVVQMDGMMGDGWVARRVEGLAELKVLMWAEKMGHLRVEYLVLKMDNLKVDMSDLLRAEKMAWRMAC